MNIFHHYSGFVIYFFNFLFYIEVYLISNVVLVSVVQQRDPSIHIYVSIIYLSISFGLPRWLSGKESTCQCRRHRRCGFNPWVGKILWSRKWQPTPVFLPGKSHGQRSLVGYSPSSPTGVARLWLNLPEPA